TKGREQQDIVPVARAPLGMWQWPMSEMKSKGRCAILVMFSDGTGWSAMVDMGAMPRRRDCDFNWSAEGEGITLLIGETHATVDVGIIDHGSDKIEMSWQMRDGVGDIPMSWMFERPVELARGWSTTFEIVDVKAKM